MGNKRMKEQRSKLAYRQKWKCFWCGKQMKPPHDPATKSPIDPLSLTLYHLDCKLTPERGTHQGECRRVAACWECNNIRNKKKQESLPKETLRARARRWPQKTEQSLESP